MNFITFSVDTTNIFPCANSTANGQLLTEFNVRSREMVATDPNITYQVGPSYTHGLEDFEVSIQQDIGGVYLNGYTLEIAEGRAIINGHYVETLVPMTIDLLEANASLQNQARPVLKGDLAIGIRTFYSTEQTVAGSILAENDEDMYLGIQLVILPTEEMITPSESPQDASKVTADLRLATFTFVNNSISNLRNLKSKIQFLNSARVADLEELTSEKFITKYGLNSKKLYAFAGKGTDPSTGKDTWEDVTDSMIVWDNEPQRVSYNSSYKEAQFVNANDAVYFVMPHKQVTGMTDDAGNDEFYADKILKLPIAVYNDNTAGIVNSSYTRQIKTISNKVEQFRSTLTGKQIMFMDVRNTTDELPPINDTWEIGDYILVREDAYYEDGASDTASPPATKYVVLPGVVEEIEYFCRVMGNVNDPAPFPEGIEGSQLGYLEWYQAYGQDWPDTSSPEYYPTFFTSEDAIRGLPKDSETGNWVDYFRLRYFFDDTEATEDLHPYYDYYYCVSKTASREWSDAILITGAISFADEDSIGGFLNVNTSYVDEGYVILDDEGHLRLIDYDILRSGTLAYQIATDVTTPTVSSLVELQSYLDEYVCNRVAFPNTANLTDGQSVIHIYMTIPTTDDGGELNIYGLDSRFNTAVCLHIQGEDILTNVTINIRDCEKLIIANDIQGTPVINVLRTCLYYDPNVFNYIRSCPRSSDTYGSFTGFTDLSIWYAQIESDDPALVVNDMTVSELDAQIISSEIDYWKELGTAANDSDYLVALKSITFSAVGDIVGCEVLAANNSTDNVEPGDKMVVGNIILPQGTQLTYPIACLTRKLKVSGQFTTAYYSDEYWYVTDNSFTLLTGIYNPYSTEEAMTGTVAFHSKTSLIPSTISQESIEPWEPDTYNVFSGGAIS